AALGIGGLTVWVALLFDENVAKPLLGLSSDLAARAAAADLTAPIDTAPAQHLGPLGGAAVALHHALAEERAAQRRIVGRETMRLNREKALFETLVHDLADGVVVATPDGRVMLFNRAATALLGPLGLDRPLAAMLRPEPLAAAIKRLEARLARGETATERFLAATADGGRILVGRVSPVVSSGDRIGHVILLRDATEDLEGQRERDHLFNALLEAMRRPAAAMGPLLDIVVTDAEIDAETRTRFTAALMEEHRRMTASLHQMEARQNAAAMRHWPMSAVGVDDILCGLAARVDLPLSVQPTGHFFRGDGFAILELLAGVLRGLAADGTRQGFTLGAREGAGEVCLTLAWDGPDAPDGALQSWLNQALSPSYGAYSGRDALTAHRTDMWAEPVATGPCLVLPLKSATAPEPRKPSARPAFYDFDLPALAAGQADRVLRDLCFVVFDTETTGLSPSSGDEIVQIGAVRIVNGRVLDGDRFDALVKPRQPIPPGATLIHGIDDSMVRDAAPMAEVGRAFHSFCEGAVLVAHNAPFDLAFLRRCERDIGAAFDAPALCTVLLSAALFDHVADHTLDALALRLGIPIPDTARHTALGDATVTAAVFLRLLDLLEANGITTLDAAHAASAEMTAIRRQQRY
ncbi:MAG: exonuclease domain-containing protein, partial [Pseudomonadota bacterium]